MKLSINLQDSFVSCWIFSKINTLNCISHSCTRNAETGDNLSQVTMPLDTQEYSLNVVSSTSNKIVAAFSLLVSLDPDIVLVEVKKGKLEFSTMFCELIVA